MLKAEFIPQTIANPMIVNNLYTYDKNNYHLHGAQTGTSNDGGVSQMTSKDNGHYFDHVKCEESHKNGRSTTKDVIIDVLIRGWQLLLLII